jgi:endo-1,3(4)-beta-glucanase
MKSLRTFILKLCVSIFLLLVSFSSSAQTVSVGNGSYTTNFPGTDEAGRNGFPSGSPQLSGNAQGKPVPTNDWWSKVVKEDHADNLFNYPMTLKTTNTGLIVTYIPWGVIGDSQPIKVGLTGLSTSKTTVSDYSDWTVSMNWKDSSEEMTVTSGIGMPFLYFEKENDDEVAIQINSGNTTIVEELLIVENASHGADFVFYAPVGSTWTKSGNTYTSSLNNKTYWSMAMLPQEGSSVTAIANEYKKYAYVFPANTETDWSYNENNGVVQTDFTVTTQVKEGSHTNMLLGLLPHQWSNLSANSATPQEHSYSSVRGEIKTLDGNSFSVVNTYSGILPTMPYLANYSEGFSPADMSNKISQIKNDGLATWTDSYNEGQVMNRLIQTARIADQTGDIEARDKMIGTVKERLEDWLTYQSGEKAFLFYYNQNWSALLGYPAGHGQDNNINDHHFHWGYFIHAAAFMEQFEPGWANQWGDFINYLVRDAASPNRDDAKFPFLRNFSPYAGHCWANGFATFPQGNDQESTSESMQFNSSLIHWGAITGNDEIRDLGVYLYTTEQSAVEEYWFDMHERNFKDNQRYGMVSRVWGNSYDNGTFWTADITASYGIEMYPIHGGSLYLGQNQAYLQKIWGELQSNTGILSTTDTNPNLWHDTFWKYLSFLDPERAIELYNSYPDRVMKFGVSDAQTYHWLHAMNALGKLKPEITANYPITAVFEKDGENTYVVHNYSNTARTVTFSDGFELTVDAYKMATNKDTDVNGVLTTDFDQAYTNGSVNLFVEPIGSDITKIEFYKGSTLLGEATTPPYQIKATKLALGVHGMSAKVYAGDKFNVTNTVNVRVGEQIPYSGSPIAIPGTFEAGHYDKFEGGKGQEIAYVDLSTHNEGNFRTEEAVDSETVNGQGATIGWISSGEWVEYTVNVANAGNYNLTFNYASANASGGGPFFLEVDGKKISDNISVSRTSTQNWSTFNTKTVSNIPFNKGKQVLRLGFDHGEFNLGKLSFAYAGSLGYEPPFADAGENVTVVLPETTASLDGTASTGPENQTLSHTWEQVYGPSAISLSDTNSPTPSISNLEKGVYKFSLTVGYENYTSLSDVLVIVSENGNTEPAVVINTPNNNSVYREGTSISITATASDLDGQVTRVEFFDGETKLGEDTNAPYSFDWTGASAGNHILSAKVTDDDGATSLSDVINVRVDEVKKCTETSKQAQQGSLSKGVTATFETIGENVSISFELLDTDKPGLVAYLWKKSPFDEAQMDFVSGRTFSKTISGVTEGETIEYAVKFAYAGGLVASKYFSYVVGDGCEPADSDGDGVIDTEDTCPNTPANSAVNSNGCAESQLDDDNDGVSNELDQCPNTPANTFVDAVGCVSNNGFSLDANNFTIEVNGETCINKSNGSVSISALEDYSYIAKLGDASYPLVNKNVSIENLEAGDYELCIEVVGQNYQQCYSLEIEAGVNIAAKSTETIKNASIEIEEGTAPFDVYINGKKVFSTENKSFSTPIKNGDMLEVYTDVACEGVFQKTIDLYADIGVYPNPTKGSVEIRLPNSEEEILFEVFTVYSQLVSTVKKAISDEKTQLDLSSYPAGIYFIRIHLDKAITLKIIKQ